MADTTAPSRSSRTSMTAWGLSPRVDADVHWLDGEASAAPLIESAERGTIAYGMGRSYGDSALGDHILRTTRHNHYLSFDPETGLLHCEAGVTLEDVLRTFVPRGWFLPVTPGTKFVSVGGAVAADVHGKNHHREGSFGTHVEELTLLRADGSISVCGPHRDPDLFETTCGGMGLTGIILSVVLRLRPVQTAYIRERILPAANLEEVMDLFDRHHDWTYSVAWIDCLAHGDSLGRSILRLGEHATPGELPLRLSADPLGVVPRQRLSVPFPLPAWLLNRRTVGAFNAVYYRFHARAEREHITDYDSFFYPLDSIAHWNRMYGRRGFTQYQFVLPLEHSRRGLRELLKKIAASGLGSFLAVLKLFGPEERFISFPREGYTLALDFPLRDELYPLLNELDEIVHEHGGRLYLAKDVRMSAATFQKTYPQAAEFKRRLKMYDPHGRFASHQSRRLEISS